MSEHRHPGRDRPGLVARAAGLVPLLAALACAALLAACGGSSAGVSSGGASPDRASSPAATAQPTPVPSPIITSGEPPTAAVDVVREYWDLVGEGRAEQAQRLVAPGSPMSQWEQSDSSISRAHVVRVIPGYTSGGPAPRATVMVVVSVWIEPTSGNTPWGDTGEHQMFHSVARMSDGSWRLWESGTSP